MAGHSDSKIGNSYLDDSEFEEKEREILLGLSNGGVRFRGHGEGTFCVSFLPWQESAIMESSRVAAAHEWEVS